MITLLIAVGVPRNTAFVVGGVSDILLLVWVITN